MKLCKLAALAACMIVPSAAHAAVELSSLYQAYENNNYSTLSMEERNKPLRISAIALELSTNLKGAPILAAGNDDGYELARLSTTDKAQQAVMTTLRPGQKFEAECVLQFTSGSDWMAFHDCRFN
ncbi:hypothetical protein [Pseudomonas sp. NPDC089401]|uniref:hypothetical protein n=1 Tax=Pseudomonas sp. NPDC089401 TaxID=3364462 RepID=UPI0037F83CB0